MGVLVGHRFLWSGKIRWCRADGKRGDPSAEQRSESSVVVAGFGHRLDNRLCELKIKRFQGSESTIPFLPNALRKIEGRENVRYEVCVGSRFSKVAFLL
jgi:hypothetical protein